MATFDLGRVTPLYKGDYSASTSYELNDVVLYNGNLYWHVQATPTVGILPTDTTVWKLAFADEGVRAEIRGYADNAQASADSALASKSAAATNASNASASASQAALSAQSASTKASEASTSAQTASTKASEASTSAQSAASSAQTATDKATLASQKAAAASESASLATAKANAAATSETNAVTAAQTATTKASEAAASATSAQEYDESAQASAVNAQTAQTAAETAQTAAETAQGLAEDARDEAQQIKDDVEDAIADKADSAEIGDLSQLTTTAKDNLVSAINEANDAVTGINDRLTQQGTSIGDLSQLNTEEKTNLVAAINEAAQVDDTLTISGAAADAKVTGDALTALSADLDENVSDLKSAISESTNEISEPTRNINTASVGRYTTNNRGVISEGDNKVFGMSEYVPCEGNTEYTVSFVDVPSLAGRSFYAYYCTKDSNGTFISKLYTTISSSSGAGTFTTPADAAQIHIIAYISAGISDIAGGKIQLEKGATKSQYIPPISATDYVARQEIENADVGGKAPKTWFIEKKITQTDMPNGGYIKTNGDFQTYGNAICSNMIPITGYTSIDAYTRLGDVGCVIAFYDANQNFLSDIKVVGNDSGALKHYIVDITGASYSDAKYVRISCYNSASYDSFYCEFHAYYTGIVNGMINPLLGLKVNALGDSITSIDYTRPNWWEMISDKTGASFSNYGVSGTSIAKLSDTASHGLSFVERYTDMSNDADIVVVMGGTNDGSAQIGAWDSSDITTFYGALNTLIMGLIDKYPGKPIIFCTMMRRPTDVITDNNPWETLQNKAATDTLSLQLRAEAIKHKCLQYGIPCVDIYNTSGINGLDANDVYYRSGDQLHPSAYGQKRLAAVIMAELNKFAQFID